MKKNNADSYSITLKEPNYNPNIWLSIVANLGIPYSVKTINDGFIFIIPQHYAYNHRVEYLTLRMHYINQHIALAADSVKLIAKEIVFR